MSSSLRQDWIEKFHQINVDFEEKQFINDNYVGFLIFFSQSVN